jgi:uncharacterized protein YPO0396
MDRGELTLAIAGALLAAVALGWTLAALTARLDTRGPRNTARTRDLAARLDAAEAARARAEARLAEVEDDFKARLAEMQADFDATLARLARAEAQTEEIRAAYRAARQEEPGA